MNDHLKLNFLAAYSWENEFPAPPLFSSWAKLQQFFSNEEIRDFFEILEEKHRAHPHLVPERYVNPVPTDVEECLTRMTEHPKLAFVYLFYYPGRRLADFGDAASMLLLCEEQDGRIFCDFASYFHEVRTHLEEWSMHLELISTSHLTLLPSNWASLNREEFENLIDQPEHETLRQVLMYQILKVVPRQPK